MREIKLKYLCKSFSNAIAAKELNSEATNGYPVYGAAGLMGYKDSYDTDVEYLGIVKDGAGVGRINVYPAKSSLLGTMATIIPNNNVDIKWLQYAISNLNLGESVDKATIPHIYFSVYGNSYIRDISISDQQKIAAHLDRKCTQIDALISNAQQQIEKLKAYKQSVITETVTKGLDPDVKMKDSGVEWIGEIPEHWEVIRLKFLLQYIIDCPHETPNYSFDGEYYVIRTADEDYGFLRADEQMYRLDEKEYKHRIRRLSLDKDDIVYGREGERWGLACIVPESNKYCLGQRMMQFRCNEHIVPMFIMWALNSKNIYVQGCFDTLGSTSPHVNISTIINYEIPIPSYEEQNKLASFLEEKCSRIDKLIALKQQKIEKLQQYKKSLIYEYVTGKKEV